MPKRKRGNTKTDQNVNEEQDVKDSVLGGLKDPALNSRVSGKEEEEDAESQEPGVTHFDITFGEKFIVCEKRGRDDDELALIFTHGAGGGIANPATKDFCAGFAMVDPIVCFQGTMNLQNRVKTFHATIDHHEGRDLALGGRSMGARAAVLTALARDEKPSALVLVSYPLTGGKKGEKREDQREKILLDLPEDIDVLFVYGSEDIQCDSDLLAEVTAKMKATCWFMKVEGADHSMSLKDKSAVQKVRMWTGVTSGHWLDDRDDAKRYCTISWDREKGEVRHPKWRRTAT